MLIKKLFSGFCLIILIFSVITCRGIRTTVIDQKIPGCAGGWIAMNAEPGIHDRDFHISFEKDDHGYYAYYNGSEWEPPIKITENKMFRSGAYLSVDPRNGDVHFCWGTEDKKIQYRKLNKNTLSDTETLVTNVAWRQADITVDNKGVVYLVANTTSNFQLAVHLKRSESQWTMMEIPYTDEYGIWAATIVHTSDNGLYVACRRKETHPTLWWHYNGTSWSDEGIIDGHNYEPNLLAFSSGFKMACYGSRLTPYFIGPDGIRIQISNIAGCLRGARVGLAYASDGKYFASFSSMNGNKKTDRIENLEVDGDDRFYFAVSKDRGVTWETTPVTEDNTGQGWGNIAINGNRVLIIWPDIRGGKHLRYSVFNSSDI